MDKKNFADEKELLKAITEYAISYHLNSDTLWSQRAEADDIDKIMEYADSLIHEMSKTNTPLDKMINRELTDEEIENLHQNLRAILFDWTFLEYSYTWNN